MVQRYTSLLLEWLSNIHNFTAFWRFPPLKPVLQRISQHSIKHLSSGNGKCAWASAWSACYDLWATSLFSAVMMNKDSNQISTQKRQSIVRLWWETDADGQTAFVASHCLCLLCLLPAAFLTLFRPTQETLVHSDPCTWEKKKRTFCHDESLKFSLRWLVCCGQLIAFKECWPVDSSSQP